METIETVFFWAAIGLYTVGWLVLMGGLVFRKSWAGRLQWPSLTAGFAGHTAAILSRWIATGHGPVMRDFENAMAGSWVIVALTLALAWRRRAHGLIATVGVPVAMLLMGFGLTRVTGLEPLSPALKTPWLYIHVTFAWISFGAFTASACGAIVFLVKHARARDVTGDGEAARSLRMIDELQFRLITYGFVAAAVMIASGAIWARLLWGSYWGWDPVETWSLASWLVYGLYIHFRLIFRWRMKRAAWFALAAVIPVFVSFWGVGSLMTSRHLFSIMDMIAQ